MTTRVLTAHVPIALAEKVDELAGQLDRSRGWIVKEALTNWIDREERRHQMTLEAMADVRAGHFIEEAEMDAWVASLDRDDPPSP